MIQATLEEARRVARETILIEECCPFEETILKCLSCLYWKVTDHGYQYFSLKDWEKMLGEENLLECIKDRGVIRDTVFIVRP